MFVGEVGELDDVGDDLVGGEFLDEVGAEEFEVAEVGGDGGVGAVHAFGDLTEGESLLSELVGLEEFGSAGGVGEVGEGHGRSRVRGEGACTRVHMFLWDDWG